MWMVKIFQNVDFGIEVLFQLLVELVHVNGLDGDIAWLLLLQPLNISTTDQEASSGKQQADTRQKSTLQSNEGSKQHLTKKLLDGTLIATHRHGPFVNSSKASPANLLKSSEASDCHFWLCRISRPP